MEQIVTEHTREHGMLKKNLKPQFEEKIVSIKQQINTQLK
jgi:hypothetical protein